MIKPPSLRVSCFADLLPEVLSELQGDFRWVWKPVSFTISDFELYGSGARDAWEFGSDFDYNCVTGLPRDKTLQMWRSDPGGPEVVRRNRALAEKWGIRFQPRFEYPETGVKVMPFLSCYSLRDRVHYHPEAKQKVDYDPRTGTVTARPPKPAGRYFFSKIVDGTLTPFEDPYPPEEVEKWAKLYGAKFQRIGDTPDTAYLKQ